jgi:hypothetical protein
MNMLNNKGSVLLQVMVAGAALLGGTAYFLNTNNTQTKIMKTLTNKSNRSVVASEMSELLANDLNCIKTLGSAGAQITQSMPIPAVLNEAGEVLYQPGDELLGHKLIGLSLTLPTSYTLDRTLKHVSAQLVVELQALETRKGNKGSYGAQTIKSFIPLSIVVYDNKVKTCSSDDTGFLLDAMGDACAQLEGTFNLATARCENLTGASGYVIKHLTKYFCTLSSSLCPHPLANQECSGVDVRGDAYNNWVMKGFKADGSPECDCVPLYTCPARSQYCRGVDLGTDGCHQDCRTGTSTDADCLTIDDPTPTPSPTGSPRPRPIRSPRPRPTASPTATPTSTPKPSPTGSPKASPTPTPTPTPTASKTPTGCPPLRLSPSQHWGSSAPGRDMCVSADMGAGATWKLGEGESYIFRAENGQGQLKATCTGGEIFYTELNINCCNSCRPN